MKFEGEWFFEKNIYSSAEEADAIVVLTEWEEYSNINWVSISKKMRKPAWVFDARSIVSEKEVLKANLNFGELVMEQFIVSEKKTIGNHFYYLFAISIHGDTYLLNSS